MSALGIQIDVRDSVTTSLGGLADGLAHRIQTPIGQGVSALFRRHFDTLASERHHGFAPANFYATASRRTSWFKDDSGVTISIRQQGIAQRYFGGVIEPVKAKMLTIPANEDTYGRRAGEFPNMHIEVFKTTGKVALVMNAATNISIYQGRMKKDGTRGQGRVVAKSSTIGRVMFWLVPFVVQRPDPTVLPTVAEIQGSAYLAIQDWLLQFRSKPNAPSEPNVGAG